MREADFKLSHFIGRASLLIPPPLRHSRTCQTPDRAWSTNEEWNVRVENPNAPWVCRAHMVILELDLSFTSPKFHQSADLQNGSTLNFARKVIVGFNSSRDSCPVMPCRQSHDNHNGMPFIQYKSPQTNQPDIDHVAVGNNQPTQLEISPLVSWKQSATAAEKNQDHAVNASIAFVLPSPSFNQDTSNRDLSGVFSMKNRNRGFSPFKTFPPKPTL